MSCSTGPWSEERLRLRRGSVGGAIGIVNDVDDRMIEHQRMQSDGGAEERNDFHFRLQAVDVQKWGLILSFATVDGQVANVHAQAERDGVQFSQFDASAGEFLRRRDHSTANPQLKRIGGDVPGEQTESDQTENAERQKEFPQDAPALGRSRLGGVRRGSVGGSVGGSFNGSALRHWTQESGCGSQSADSPTTRRVIHSFFSRPANP